VLPFAPVWLGPTSPGASGSDRQTELLLERAGAGTADGVVLPAGSGGALLELRASEVASPHPGDQLTVGGETFIQGEPERRDPERRVWSIDVRRRRLD
jgi:hypothetical protein